MGTVTPAGWIVACKGKLLKRPHYTTEFGAKRRVELERSAGVEARAYPVFFSTGWSEA